ncbi:histamine N-methyltransferase-like [Vanacampus margaritifer]
MSLPCRLFTHQVICTRSVFIEMSTRLGNRRHRESLDLADRTCCVRHCRRVIKSAKSYFQFQGSTAIVTVIFLHSRIMAAQTKKQSMYEGSEVQIFQLYLQHSDEHAEILRFLLKCLPKEFKRIATDKSNLAVLGVGSGGGELDVQMLSILQSVCPTLPISADVVEGSTELVANFKALVAKTDNLEKIPFTWHVMLSEDYKKQVKDVKKYDFIHMIQMIYYVDNLTETIKFYHSCLNKNGRLMIIVGAAGGSYDILWKAYSKELCNETITPYRSSGDILASVKTLGLKYEEHCSSYTLDITECFDPNSETGQRLLCFMTATDDFSRSFTPQIRADMLNFLRTKCSTEKEGKVYFNVCLGYIFVHA